MINGVTTSGNLSAQPLRVGFTTNGAEHVEPGADQLEDGRPADAGRCTGDDNRTQRHVPLSFWSGLGE